jgi:hypothetical protein
MNKRLATLFGVTTVLWLSLAACTFGDDEKVPEWLVVRMVAYEAAPPESAPSEIWQISLKGKPAFYIRSACCDDYNPLLNYKGEEICKRRPTKRSGRSSARRNSVPIRAPA